MSINIFYHGFGIRGISIRILKYKGAKEIEMDQSNNALHAKWI
jgi:hypothetical protein